MKVSPKAESYALLAVGLCLWTLAQLYLLQGLAKNAKAAQIIYFALQVVPLLLLVWKARDAAKVGGFAAASAAFPLLFEAFLDSFHDPLAPLGWLLFYPICLLLGLAVALYASERFSTARASGRFCAIGLSAFAGFLVLPAFIMLLPAFIMLLGGHHGTISVGG